MYSLMLENLATELPLPAVHVEGRNDLRCQGHGWMMRRGSLRSKPTGGTVLPPAAKRTTIHRN